MKTFSKVTLLLALALALSLIACDDEEDDPPVDDPKPQSATITFGANNSLSTNVTGHMTDAQWDNVIGKLTTALNAAATAEPGFCTSMFGAGVNINLVKTQEYSYYKINVEGKIFSLNADYVIGATQADLSAKVSTAINAPFTGGSLQQ